MDGRAPPTSPEEPQSLSVLTSEAVDASSATSTSGRPAVAGGAALVPTAQRRPVRRIIGQQVPKEILENEALNTAIAILPANYNFEVHKTVWRLRQARARRVALQLPEGLQVR